MAVGREQAALAGIVVAGTALGALLLRPDGDLFGRGTGPLGGNSLVVVLLAIGWLVGGISLANRYRAQLAYDPDAGPVQLRLTDAVRAVLLITAVALPLLLLVLHRFSGGGGATDGGHARPKPITLRTPPPLRPPPLRPPSSHHGGNAVLLRVLIGLGIAVAAALVVWAAVFLWRRFRFPVAQGHVATYGTADDEQELLAQAVDSGRRALLDGEDARAAVIACYAAMEESLAASGVARHASDSPQDLMERATASGLLTVAAVTVLTALFREARYSTHPMDGGHRDRAAAALAEIAAQLTPAEAVT